MSAVKLRVYRDGPLPGAVNMSADARLLEEHAPGDDPVLRVYRWRPWSVTRGWHQPDDGFAHDVIAERGWDLVRRPTGGRAILHAQELTYAVVGTSPSDLFGENLHATYMTINRALVAFLEALGLAPDISEGESLEEARGAVCFQSAGRHEVTVGGRKIIGSAQRRSEGVFLQHGSILAGPAHVDLLDVLPGAENTPGRREALLDATTDLSRELGRDLNEQDLDEATGLLVRSFAEVLALEPVEEGSSIRPRNNP